ncbi:hypothetical protein K438DRAFT_843885 [Mycena galopus ATCC 62051]|nr:hypothetical protein K438DRAFT_843885 [Mycena galopus ATCC 62051]
MWVGFSSALLFLPSSSFLSPRALYSLFLPRGVYTDAVTRIAAACTPVAPSHPAGASCTSLCTATTNTASRPRRPSAAQYPAHPRYETQQALPFFHIRATLMDPMRPTTVFSRVDVQRQYRVAQHPPRPFPIPYATFLVCSYPSTLSTQMPAPVPAVAATPRTRPAAVGEPACILAAAVKDLEDAKDGGRGRKRKTEGSEEDEGAGGGVKHTKKVQEPWAR